MGIKLNVSGIRECPFCNSSEVTILEYHNTKKYKDTYWVGINPVEYELSHTCPNTSKTATRDIVIQYKDTDLNNLIEKWNTRFSDWVLLENETPTIPDFYEVTRDYGDGDYESDILWWQVKWCAFEEGGDTDETIRVTNVIAWKRRSNPYIPDEMVGRVKF